MKSHFGLRDLVSWWHHSGTNGGARDVSTHTVQECQEGSSRGDVLGDSVISVKLEVGVET